MKRVQDIMTSPVRTIGPDARLRDALRMMNEHHIRQVPVVRDGALIGILTDRDIRLHVIHLEDRHEEGGVWNRALETPVDGVMTRSAKVLRPEQEVREAVEAFLREKFGGFPVVDHHGRLVGILTYIDLLRELKDHLA